MFPFVVPDNQIKSNKSAFVARLLSQRDLFFVQISLIVLRYNFYGNSYKLKSLINGLNCLSYSVLSIIKQFHLKFIWCNKKEKKQYK